uniref:Uncharacterized protein n=1 Tax=Cacopsylla melanoneura TaxID=428564 RepID=A0A8D8QR85_9HEMI
MRKKCVLCNKTGECIQCTYCEMNICLTCADISTFEANLLKKQKNNLKYECTSCCEKEASKSKSSDGVSQLAEVVKNLQQQIQLLQQSIESMKNNRENDPSDKSSYDMDTIINEMSERNKREKNIIIYDVPECNSDNQVEISNYDKSKFKDIVVQLKVKPIDPRKIIRLGKPDQSNPQKPRPLLVTLSTKGEAIAMLKNAREKHLGIKHDLTPFQRDKLKDLQSKLQEKMGKGDNQWKIKYVRGTPQLIKINSEPNLTR